MKVSAYLIFLLSAFFSQLSIADSMTNKLIVKALNAQIPQVLYEHENQPWNLGVYSLRIDRSGIPSFSSNESQLVLSFPVNVSMNGKVDQTIFGKTIVVNCENSFVTHGRIVIEPLFDSQPSTANVDIQVPVPETDLNCEGLSVAVQPLLEQLVAEKKVEWEHEMEAEMNKLFKQLGI
jgi:hypothetical protein